MYDLAVKTLSKSHNPRGIFATVQQINEVDEDSNPVFTTKVWNQIAYVVSMGFKGPYVSYRGTRVGYSTYKESLRMLREANTDAAKLNGDTIVEHRLVFAHDKNLVQRIYGGKRRGRKAAH